MMSRAVVIAALCVVCAAGCGEDTTTYRSSWDLESIAPDRRSIQIIVIEGCGGRARFDHAEFAESKRGLIVTPVSRRPNGDCTAEAMCKAYTIELPRQLGNDEVVLRGPEGDPAGCDF